jgi:hypothetical protein
MTGDLLLGDNVKIEIGDQSGGDLQIYHDGSDSYIHDAGTGTLTVRTSGFNVNNATNTESMITATENGNVVLYFDNDAKLATNSGGVAVTGTITATTFSGSGASLTNLPAANISGTLPAISGANLTNIPAANLTGTLVSTLIFDYDNIPTSNPNVKGRLYRTAPGAGGISELRISQG